MSDSQIKKDIAKWHRKIEDAKQQIEFARLHIKHIQDFCPHSDVKSWTNDDGDGRFTVNRCNVCGLQKDGPLK